MLKQMAIAFLFSLTSTFALAEDAPKLNDAQIAHIAYTAGAIDVSAAKLALEKTENAEVRAFAELMESDHNAVNEEALALVKRLNVTPEENEISASLTNQAAEAETHLQALSGDEFDRAYVENEVAYHQAVNDALKSLLIPNAQNSDLKSLLETGLALFQEHQTHAEHLLHEMK
jgi:putative membrane protein